MPKLLNLQKKNDFTEIGENLKLEEIETASSRFKICPKCHSTQGFWLGLMSDHAYVQCKDCGAKLELFEVYTMGEKGRSPQRLKFFRK